MAPIPTVATRIPVEPRTLVSPSKAGGATAPHALLLRTAGATATAAAAHPNTLRTLLLSASKPPSVPLSAFPPSKTPISPPVSIGFFPVADQRSLISPIVTGFGDGRLPGPRPPERGNRFSICPHRTGNPTGRETRMHPTASAFYRLSPSLWGGGCRSSSAGRACFSGTRRSA